MKWGPKDPFQTCTHSAHAMIVNNLLTLSRTNRVTTFEDMSISDGSNYVRSFEAKNRVFEFDYQYMNMFVRCSKNDVRVSSMSNLVNLMKTLLGSKLNV